MANEELADPELDYRDETLALVAKRAIEVSAREGEQVETIVNAPDEVSGAIEAGDPIGTVTVTVGGRNAGKSPLVAADSVEAATTVDKVLSVVMNPVVLIPAGLGVIVVGMLLASAGRRRGRARRVTGPAPSGNGSRAAAAPPPQTKKPAAPRSRRRKRDKATAERTPEERRKMQEERMRRRAQRSERQGGDGP